MKLNAQKFGLAAGILWGLTMFVFTFVNLWFDYGSSWLNLMADAYPGYEISPIGALFGLVYGFLDGFVGCFLFAWLYNKLVD